MKVIAYIETDFKDKFGIPRQSGLIDALEGRIVFVPEYRNREALRGIEEFSHLWLLWQFSEITQEKWSPTVRPPRLGGNKRVGVFATRSPFRPNPIGLSAVKLKRVGWEEADGPVLYVTGVDLLSGTPIYDIKPYLPFTDCHPDATGGYTDLTRLHELFVVFPEELLQILPKEKRMAAMEILKQDPRPGYSRDADRVYGVSFAGYNLKFVVDEEILTVVEVTQTNGDYDKE